MDASLIGQMMAAGLFIYLEARALFGTPAQLPSVARHRPPTVEEAPGVLSASWAEPGPLYVVNGPREETGVALLQEAQVQQKAVPQVELLSLDEPYIWIPAQNIYYDSAESATWW